MTAVLSLVLLGTAFFVLNGPLVNGLTCLHCSGISNPNDCRTTSICSSSEMCFTQRIVSSTLSESYTMGCGYRQMCEEIPNIIGKRNVVDVNRRDVSTCRQCCLDSNNCNRGLCRDASDESLPSTHGIYVRLIGGPNAYEGTVQVYHNSEWGAICDDGWTAANAQVVCKMLGYTTVGATALQGGLYQSSSTTTRIWLDEVRCRGTEDTLDQCQKNSWGVNDCSHGEDAGVACESVNTEDNIIYLLDTAIGVIIRMNLLTQSFVPIPLSNVYIITSFDYDPEQQRLYIADGILDLIFSVRFDGTDVKEVRQLDTNTAIEEMELDPLNRMLFYSDYGNKVIASMNLDGSAFRRIITSGLDRPRDVLVDPRNRKVYWSDIGATSKIERANYDGTYRETLVTSGLVVPNGMAIDYEENLLYFVDAGTHNIEVMHLDGTGRRVILHDSTARFFSLEVFGKYIYYTDWNKYTVMRVNKDGRNKTTVGPASFQQLSDIRLSQYASELPGVTTSSPLNFDPSHVFVRIHGPAKIGYVEVYANRQWGTICDDHWDANDAAVICRMVGLNPSGARAFGSALTGHGQSLILLDEVSCLGNEEHIVDCGISPRNWGHHDCSHAEDAGVLCTIDNTGTDFLLFTSGDLLNRMSTKTYSYTVVDIPTDQPNPIAIAYNPVSHRVFFTEVKTSPGSQIYSADMDGENPILIRQLPYNAVADGLEIDTVNNLLFYTDDGSDVIVSMHLDGTNPRTIVSTGLERPRAIVADPRNRVIYWTDWGATPKIEKANYDGSNRHTIVSSNIVFPNGLELDRREGLLYFCDSQTHTIESISTSGSGRRVVFKDNSAHFFDLYLTDQYIYYSDWNKNGVMRINRDGSGQVMVGPPSFSRISGITGYPQIH